MVSYVELAARGSRRQRDETPRARITERRKVSTAERFDPIISGERRIDFEELVYEGASSGLQRPNEDTLGKVTLQGSY